MNRLSDTEVTLTMKMIAEYHPGNLEDGIRILRLLVRRSGFHEMVGSNILRRAVETVFAMDIKTFTYYLRNYLYEHRESPAIRQYTLSTALDHCDGLSLKERRTMEGYSVSTAIRHEQEASKSIAIHLLSLGPQEKGPGKRSSTLDALVKENRELREENILLHSKLEKVAAVLSTALNDTLRL